MARSGLGLFIKGIFGKMQPAMLLSNEIVQALAAETDVALLQSKEKFLSLKEAVNDLIINDFNLLLRVLYTTDVREDALKKMLQEHPGEDAAELISKLLIERQLEKINTRKNFASNPGDIPEDEKW